MRGEGNVSDKVKVFNQHRKNIQDLEDNLTKALGGKKQITESVIHSDDFSEGFTNDKISKLLTGEDNTAAQQYDLTPFSQEDFFKHKHQGL